MDNPTNSVRAAYGMYKARDNVPFQILVTNFSKRPVTLPENMPILVDTKLPETIVPYDDLAPSSNTEVGAVHKKYSED